MNNVPKVSVVIPAYNAEKYIGEAIASVLEQDFSDFELIVVDDCSTDATREIVFKYCEMDSRVRLVANTRNLGLGKNRAVGVNQARGKFIAWLDADDISLPHRLTSQLSVIESDSSIGVVGGAIEFFDENGPGKTRSYPLDDSTLRKKIFRQNPVAAPASMFRADVFKKVGNYRDLRYCEDLEMLLRTGTEFKFANVSTTVVRYRQLTSSLTQKNLRQMEARSIGLRRAFRSNPAYSYGILDYLFLLGQEWTMWMPARIRMTLFAMIRGDKK